MLKNSQAFFVTFLHEYINQKSALDKIQIIKYNSWCWLQHVSTLECHLQGVYGLVFLFIQ